MIPVRQPPLRETPMRADPIRSGLRPLTLGRSGLLGAHNFRAVLLTAGSAELTTGTVTEHMEAPVLLWTPWEEHTRLTIAPGSQDSHLALGPALLSQALRHNPNAADLGYMAERRYIVPLAANLGLEAMIAGSFAGLVAETRDDAPMSASMVESHLAILLVALYRALKSGADDGELGARKSPLASRFVTLIEAHLGERWTVAAFCDALGVTREQLTATCLRSFGRTPGVMVRQRVMMEARRLLEQSTLSVDQIAQRLGFPSSPQFNRFFNTQESQPPGRYRRQFLSGRTQAAAQEDLYAWP